MSKSVIYKEYDQCPICGDPLIIDGKDSGRLKCGCCGFNVKVEAEVSQDDTERLKAAYDALRSYEFTVAEDRYNLILDDNSFDSDIYAAALFGKLLTEFGIVYIKDFNGITIPTFSEYNPDMLSIKLSDTYEELASCKCDDKVKESYLDKIDALDNIYKRIDKELKEKEDYDVFICTKISQKTPRHPNRKGFTEDSKLADDFYYDLTKKGLKVFYSDKCCNEIEYDSQVLSALLKSKKMLVISTEKEYLESPWVQSEWRRWVNLVNCGVKDKDSLLLFFPYFEKSSFTLPRVLKKVQRKTSQIQVISLLTTDKDALEKKRIEEARVKAEAEALARKKEEELRRKEEEDRIKALDEERAKAEKARLETEKFLEEMRAQYKANAKATVEKENITLEQRKKLLEEEAKRISEEEEKERLRKLEAAKIAEQKRIAEEERLKKEREEKAQLEAIRKEEERKKRAEEREAKKAEEAQALYQLGLKALNGKGENRKLGVAYESFLDAAKKGHVEAMFSLADCYSNGRGTQLNLKEAANWYKKAAQNGHIQSAYELAQMYEEGVGVKADSSLARTNYRIAADAGNVEAQYHLAQLSLRAANYNDAYHYYKMAASSNHTKSQLELADLYLKDIIARRDVDQAIKYYQMAADATKGESLFELANRYDKGINIAKNHEEAQKWYKLAYEKGCNKALTAYLSYFPKTKVAEMYFKGDEIKADLKKAQKLYEELEKENKNTKTGKCNLAVIYYNLDKEKYKEKIINLLNDVERCTPEAKKIKEEFCLEKPKAPTSTSTSSVSSSNVNTSYYEGHPIIFGILTVVGLVVTFLVKDYLGSQIGWNPYLVFALLNVALIPLWIALTNVINEEDISGMIGAFSLLALLIELTIYFAISWIWWIVIFIGLILILICAGLASVSYDILEEYVAIIIYAFTLGVFILITTIYLFITEVWWMALVVLGSEAVIGLICGFILYYLFDEDDDIIKICLSLLGAFLVLLATIYFAISWNWWIMITIGYIAISLLLQVALSIDLNGDYWYVFTIILGVILLLVTAIFLLGALELWLYIIVLLVQIVIVIAVPNICYYVIESNLG